VTDYMPGNEPIDSSGQPRRRRNGHSPFIVNGRPADLQPLPYIDPLEWDGKEVPERRWIAADLIPEGNVTMLGGDGGLGKSTLALQLMAASALGKPWLGVPVQSGVSLGIFCEDDRDELHRRLAAVLRHYGADFTDIADAIRLSCRVDQDNLLLEFPSQWEAGQTTALYTRIRQAAIDAGAKLVVLDSLHDFFGGNENSRQHARQFIGQLRSIAMEIEGAVVLTAHPSLSGRKEGTGEAGSTAWNNAVRSRLYLTGPKRDDGESDRDYRELRSMKANYAASGGLIRLRWHDGIFERDEDQQRSPVNTVDKIDLGNKLLDEMRRMVEDGAELPSDPAAHSAFANAVRKREGFKQLGQGVVIACQRRLVDSGRAEIVRMGPPSKTRAYIRPVDMRYAREPQP
jgi:RecA-family ATPase